MSVQLASLVEKQISTEPAASRLRQEATRQDQNTSSRAEISSRQDSDFEEVLASNSHQAFLNRVPEQCKAILPGISEHDARILARVKRRAHRLDSGLFNLCGVRFGWGSVIGLIPLIGDAGDTLLAITVIYTCNQIDGGLPLRLKIMMMATVIFAFFVGLIPFMGDIADAMYKCNTRNAAMLEKYLRKKNAQEPKMLHYIGCVHYTNGADANLRHESDGHEYSVVDASSCV